MQAFVQKLREMGYERVELIDTTTGKFMPPKEAKRLMSDLLIELSCMQDWPEHYFGAVFDCEENLKSILSICKHHIELDILVILYTRNIFAAVKRYYCRKNNLMEV